MRSLVITAFLSIFVAATAVAQTADAPAMVARCSGPGRCIIVNTGPCGSLLEMKQGTIASVPPSNNFQERGTHGVCGFADLSSSVDTSSKTYCQSSADCSFTVDKCGYKAAVNTLHVGTEQARLSSESRSCGALDTRQVTEERCEDNTCVVTLGTFR